MKTRFLKDSKSFIKEIWRSIGTSITFIPSLRKRSNSGPDEETETTSYPFS